MASQGGSGRYRIGYRDPDSGSWVQGIATKAGAVLGFYDAQSGTWYVFGRRGSGGDWLEATPGGAGDFAGYFDAKLGRWVEQIWKEKDRLIGELLGEAEAPANGGQPVAASDAAPRETRAA